MRSCTSLRKTSQAVLEPTRRPGKPTQNRTEKGVVGFSTGGLRGMLSELTAPTEHSSTEIAWLGVASCCTGLAGVTSDPASSRCTVASSRNQGAQNIRTNLVNLTKITPKLCETSVASLALFVLSTTSQLVLPSLMGPRDRKSTGTGAQLCEIPCQSKRVLVGRI